MRLENRMLATATRDVVIPAHWIGKPMSSLRLRTILANLRGKR